MIEFEHAFIKLRIILVKAIKYVSVYLKNIQFTFVYITPPM